MVGFQFPPLRQRHKKTAIHMGGTKAPLDKKNRQKCFSPRDTKQRRRRHTHRRGDSARSVGAHLRADTRRGRDTQQHHRRQQRQQSTRVFFLHHRSEPARTDSQQNQARGTGEGKVTDKDNRTPELTCRRRALSWRAWRAHFSNRAITHHIAGSGMRGSV